MAAVTVTADNTRVEDAEAATGWSNIGGGASGAAEAPFAYQGSNLFNRKVTSATGAGFFYDPTSDSGSAQDMTASNRTTWMVKVMVSDYNGLDSTDGVLVRIGSDGSNYYAFVLAGSDSPVAAMAAYRDIGGLLVFPVDPNENSAYNDTGKDAGTATLTAVDYFGCVYAFASSSAKNENCGCDAIDIGSGLYLVGGDGGDADGVYQDFADEDGNTTANRWGYARNLDGGVIVGFGTWRIGTDDDSTSTATEFVDNEAIILWLDGMFAAGFSGILVDLGSASSDVTDGSTQIGEGDTSGTDTRPDYVVQGTSGSGTFSHNLRNFRNIEYTSACEVDGADIECELLTQGSADMVDSVIRTNALTSVACLQDPTFGTTTDLRDCTFIQSGAGHAIELDTATTYNLQGLKFEGYGANHTASAALDITAASGTVTINISGGGDTPTYISAGATVVINNTVTVRVTALEGTSPVQGARVLLTADGNDDLPADDTVTITRSGTTATVSHTAHGLSNGDQVLIDKAAQIEYNGVKTITNVSTNAYDYTVSGSPATPATVADGFANITATAVILDGETNASGVVEDSGFNFTNPQSVRGVVRRGTSSPLYKTSPITGASPDNGITSSGFSATINLVPDE